MSPPEVWGPAVWTLFHTFAEKINEEAYPYVSQSLFKMIVRICKFLPCPECSKDASNFLAKIKMTDMKNKTDFRNTFYLFHNYVNAKKRKRLFNSANMHIYGKYRLIDVVNNFISKYHTKGNMKLLTESFQRQIVIKEFKGWFTRYIKAFIPRVNIPAKILSEATVSVQSEEPNIVEEQDPVLEEQDPVVEEQEPITEEQETIIEEQDPVVEEQEPIIEEQEPIIQEDVIEEQKTIIEEQETIIEEEIVAEEEPGASEATVEEEPIHTKKKKGRKSKK
jgi:hypothetical protein